MLVYPDLLGTYGDRGNAVVLARRAQWRGIRAEIVEVEGNETVPSGADIYLLGGGEDDAQALATARLAESGTLHRAVEQGAAVLAVCAGFQILGETYPGAGGAPRAGLGLLDATTSRPEQPRSVGEIVVDPAPGLGLPLLTGYENHQGHTRLGPGAEPLGAVEVGIGNGDGTDGALGGRIVGTYLHGPVLARNPALADLLLSWVAGALAPLDDTEPEQLRGERLREARRARRPGAGRRRR